MSLRKCPPGLPSAQPVMGVFLFKAESHSIMWMDASVFGQSVHLGSWDPSVSAFRPLWTRLHSLYQSLPLFLLGVCWKWDGWVLWSLIPWLF